MSSLGSSIIGIIPTLFLLGAITILFKDFTVKGKKKRFDLHSQHRSKVAAQKEAKELREDGLMVRVTMKSEKGKKKEESDQLEVAAAKRERRKRRRRSDQLGVGLPE